MIRALGLSARELRETEIWAQMKAKGEEPAIDVDEQLMMFAEAHNAKLAAKGRQ